MSCPNCGYCDDDAETRCPRCNAALPKPPADKAANEAGDEAKPAAESASTATVEPGLGAAAALEATAATEAAAKNKAEQDLLDAAARLTESARLAGAATA